MTDLQPFKDQLDYTKMDANIAGLVKVMNDITTLATIDCCGGHTNPDKAARQVGTGRWYITFHTADPYAIALIASTAEKFGSAVHIEVIYQAFGKEEGLDLINLVYEMSGPEEVINDFTELLTRSLNTSPRGFWDL